MKTTIRKMWLSRDAGGAGGYNFSSRKLKQDIFGDYQPGGARFFTYACHSQIGPVVGKNLMKPGEQQRVKLTLEVME
jgi:hypothetical protein